MNFLKNRHPKRLAKFVVVGSINLLIDFSILNILSFITNTNKGIFAALFSVISFLIANINSYHLNKNWTFISNKGDSCYKIFLTISVTGVLANVFIVYTLTSINQNYFSDIIWLNISKMTASVFAAMFNYLGYKKYTFKT